MRTHVRIPLALLSLAFSANDERVPDRVDLAAGTHVEGRVVYEDAAHLVLRTGTGDKRFDLKDVKSFRSRAKLHRDSFDRFASLPSDASAPVLALAHICQQADLLEDARTYAWYVLLADRDNADAHALLDHRKRGSSWDARLGRDGEARRGRDRWIPIERLFADRPDWAEAEETTTNHYLLRTNLGQNAAVRTALDLEGFYRAFYADLGAELELYEVVDPLTVEIHADRQSFPPLASGRQAYTSTDKNVVEVDASAGYRFDELAHEATHQLVAATTRFSLAGKGAVPGWLDEGLAESFRAGVAGNPAHRTYALVAKNREHFAVHASAKSPYDLTRVLTFESGDFIASSRSDLKYAQSYTLVQFCLEGDGGRHRRGFFDFLRGAWKGSSSAQDFKKALKVDDAAFEKAWLAYARLNARDDSRDSSR
jgi:hypothetical protein